MRLQFAEENAVVVFSQTAPRLPSKHLRIPAVAGTMRCSLVAVLIDLSHRKSH
jgi:hypothetical protein